MEPRGPWAVGSFWEFFRAPSFGLKLKKIWSWGLGPTGVGLRVQKKAYWVLESHDVLVEAVLVFRVCLLISELGVQSLFVLQQQEQLKAQILLLMDTCSLGTSVYKMKRQVRHC